MRIRRRRGHDQYPIQQLVAIPVVGESFEVRNRVSWDADGHGHTLPPRRCTCPLGIGGGWHTATVRPSPNQCGKKRPAACSHCLLATAALTAIDSGLPVVNRELSVRRE